MLANFQGLIEQPIQLLKIVLTIIGAFAEKEGEGAKLIDERIYGEYRRTFTLGDVIDREKISAKLEDGVLTLTLPKHEKTKPRKIEISTE